MRMRMNIIQFICNSGFLSWNFIQQEGTGSHARITLRGLVQPMLVLPGQTRPVPLFPMDVRAKGADILQAKMHLQALQKSTCQMYFFLRMDLHLQVNLLRFCLQHWEFQSQSNKKVFQAMANMKLQKIIWNWSLGRWAGTYVLEALTAMAPAQLPVRSHFWRMFVPFWAWFSLGVSMIRLHNLLSIDLLFLLLEMPFCFADCVSS